MRCKKCLRVFSSPSKQTKQTQICSWRRGNPRLQKRSQLCEKTPKFVIERESFVRVCN